MKIMPRSGKNENTNIVCTPSEYCSNVDLLAAQDSSSTAEQQQQYHIYMCVQTVAAAKGNAFPRKRVYGSVEEGSRGAKRVDSLYGGNPNPSSSPGHPPLAGRKPKQSRPYYCTCTGYDTSCRNTSRLGHPG